MAGFSLNAPNVNVSGIKSGGIGDLPSEEDIAARLQLANQLRARSYQGWQANPAAPNAALTQFFSNVGSGIGGDQLQRQATQQAATYEADKRQKLMNALQAMQATKAQNPAATGIDQITSFMQGGGDEGAGIAALLKALVAKDKTPSGLPAKALQLYQAVHSLPPGPERDAMQAELLAYQRAAQVMQTGAGAEVLNPITKQLNLATTPGGAVPVQGNYDPAVAHNKALAAGTGAIQADLGQGNPPAPLPAGYAPGSPPPAPAMPQGAPPPQGAPMAPPGPISPPSPTAPAPGAPPPGGIDPTAFLATVPGGLPSELSKQSLALNAAPASNVMPLPPEYSGAQGDIIKNTLGLDLSKLQAPPPENANLPANVPVPQIPGIGYKANQQVMANTGKASLEGVKTDLKGQAEMANKYETGLNSRVAADQQTLLKLQEIEKTMQDFKTGGGGEVRLKMAQMGQAMGMPDKVSNWLVRGTTDQAFQAAQEFQKLAIQNSMQTLVQAMQSGSERGGLAGRATQAEFEAFQKATQSANMDPRAIIRINDFIKKQVLRDQIEQHLYSQWAASGRSRAKWPQAWESSLQPTIEGTLKNMSLPGSGAPAGGQSGPPLKNAQGWALQKDAQGNKAYVGPQGQVEEVP